MKSLLTRWALVCASSPLLLLETACHEVVSPIQSSARTSRQLSEIEIRDNGRVVLYRGSQALAAARRSASEAAAMGDFTAEQFLDTAALWNSAIRPTFESMTSGTSSLVAGGTTLEGLTTDWFPMGKIGLSSVIPTITGKAGTVKSAAEFLGTDALTVMKYSASNDSGVVVVSEQPAEFKATSDGADACIDHILHLKPESTVDPNGWYCHLTGTVRGVATITLNSACGVHVKSSATHNAWIEMWLPTFNSVNTSGTASFSFGWKKFHDSGPTSNAQTEAYNGRCAPSFGSCSAQVPGAPPSSLSAEPARPGDSSSPLTFKAFAGIRNALCGETPGGGDSGTCNGDAYWQQWFWYNNGEVTDEWWESVCSSQAAY